MPQKASAGERTTAATAGRTRAHGRRASPGSAGSTLRRPGQTHRPSRLPAAAVDRPSRDRARRAFFILPLLDRPGRRLPSLTSYRHGRSTADLDRSAGCRADGRSGGGSGDRDPPGPGPDQPHGGRVGREPRPHRAPGSRRPRAAAPTRVLFPELVLTGYPPEDLLLNERVRGRRRPGQLERLLPATRGLLVALGVPLRLRTDSCATPPPCSLDGRLGRHLRQGDAPQLRRLRREAVLPPGTALSRLRWDGPSFGVNICEDLWTPRRRARAPGPRRRPLALEPLLLALPRREGARARGAAVPPGAHARRGDRLLQSGRRTGRAGLRRREPVRRRGRRRCGRAGRSSGKRSSSWMSRRSGSDPGRPVRGRRSREERAASLDAGAARSRIDATSTWRRAAGGGGSRAGKQFFVERWRWARSQAGLPRPAIAVADAAASAIAHRAARPDAEIYAALVLGLARLHAQERLPPGGARPERRHRLGADRRYRGRCPRPAAVTGVSMPSRFNSASLPQRRARRRREPRDPLPRDPDRGDLPTRTSRRSPPSSATRRADVTEENIQARIRGTLLMALSNAGRAGARPPATRASWRSATAPSTATWRAASRCIKDVPKTLVYRLARYRNALAPGHPRGHPDARRPRPNCATNQKDTGHAPAVRDPRRRSSQARMEREEDPQALVARGLDPRWVETRLPLDRRQRVQAPPGAAGDQDHAARLRAGPAVSDHEPVSMEGVTCGPVEAKGGAICAGVRARARPASSYSS